MTQIKGGGKVRTAVRILTIILQSITNHQHPLVQMVRLPSHTSTQRRIDRKLRLNKCLTNDRTLIISLVLESTTRRIDRIEGTTVQSSVLRGGYTQIMVNPVQLTDTEFTNWMEKLVEARKNRQERKPRLYRNFRKPYNSDQSEYKKPQLKNKLQPAQELDVQSIMTTFNCEYDDVVEAVDLYNMDVEESQSA